MHPDGSNLSVFVIKLRQKRSNFFTLLGDVETSFYSEIIHICIKCAGNNNAYKKRECINIIVK